MWRLVQKVILGRQEPLTIADFSGTVANGASTQFESPVEGMITIYGQVSSSQDVTLTFDTGTDDRGGALTYDWTYSEVIAAGTAEARSLPISGNFARITISNASGVDATVRINFNARGV